MVAGEGCELDRPGASFENLRAMPVDEAVLWVMLGVYRRVQLAAVMASRISSNCR